MRNKKILALIIFILLILLFIAFFLTKKNNKGNTNDFNELEKISKIYSILKEGKVDEAKGLSDRLPYLESTSIYVAPAEVVSKIKNKGLSTNLNIEEINNEVYKRDVQNITTMIFAPTSIKILDFDERASVYFQDINKDLSGQPELKNFFEYNAINSVLPHEIILIQGGLSNNDIDTLKNSGIFLGMVVNPQKYEWKSIENTTIFETNDDENILYGVLYSFYTQDSKNAIYLDIYQYNGGKAILKYNYPIGIFETEDIESELIKVRSGIISEGKGIYY